MRTQGDTHCLLIEKNMTPWQWHNASEIPMNLSLCVMPTMSGIYQKLISQSIRLLTDSWKSAFLFKYGNWCRKVNKNIMRPSALVLGTFTLSIKKYDFHFTWKQRSFTDTQRMKMIVFLRTNTFFSTGVKHLQCRNPHIFFFSCNLEDTDSHSLNAQFIFIAGV